MDAIGIAGTGLTTHQRWLDAISDNLANLNTAKSTSGSAFQARYIEAVEDPNGNGVSENKVHFGSAAGRVVHDPTNPLADKDGNVRMPDIDMGQQMSDMIMAQRGYQANAAVVDRAKTAYEAAIQIGRG
jgi:flagellar basal-body rod protein FlgC